MIAKDKNILADIKALAEKTMPKGSHVYLYGSRARGDDNDESDWDLLLLIDKDNITNSDHDNYAYPFTSLGWDCGEAISPILYSKKQWESYSFTPFYKNLEHDKIQIL